MTTNAPLLGLDDGPFAAALRRLRQAKRDADDARQAVADAKDALGVVLHAAAAPYRIGLDELPVDLIETLYWDEPAVRVRDLASAFGLRMKTLSDLVGTRTVTVACLECGAATELVRRSRSDARRSVCEDCRFRAVMQGALAPRWDEDADGWLDPPVWRTDPRGYVDEARRRGLLDPEVEDLDGPSGW
jgi:DNA-directed RNA polymerase subunit RPC12/RpoP